MQCCELSRTLHWSGRQVVVRVEVAEREDRVAAIGQQPDDLGLSQAVRPVDVMAVHLEQDVRRLAGRLVQERLGALQRAQLRALDVEHDEVQALDPLGP